MYMRINLTSYLAVYSELEDLSDDDRIMSGGACPILTGLISEKYASINTTRS